MIYLFLAPGFEEIEALAPLDILRRAQLETATVGVSGRLVTGAHHIGVEADLAPMEVDLSAMEGIILPGGMPGTLNLEKSPAVQAALEAAAAGKKLIAAICAAPSILGHKGLLQGRRATCFPGFEEQLTGARLESGPVCRDGHIITAKGAGAAIEFGLAIAAYYKGEGAASSLGAAMQCDR